MKTLVAKSVADYVAVVCELRRLWSLEDKQYFDPWFRGHRDHDWRLEPNIFRIQLADAEGEMRAEFQRRSGHLALEREPRSDWEWYFLMQHYRAPTRLLDWSDSALVALFFAVSASDAGDTNIHCDGAVWVLDPWWLNSRVLRDKSILLPDFESAARYLPDMYAPFLRVLWPAAIDPPHIARRVGVQRSHFTVFGRRRDGLTKLAKEANSRIVKITLPKSDIPHMRLDLNTCGIGDTAIFPDLEGLSNELTRFYAYPWEKDLPPRIGSSADRAQQPRRGRR
jgi:hypothetical protein